MLCCSKLYLLHTELSPWKSEGEVTFGSWKALALLWCLQEKSGYCWVGSRPFDATRDSANSSGELRVAVIWMFLCRTSLINPPQRALSEPLAHTATSTWPWGGSILVIYLIAFKYTDRTQYSATAVRLERGEEKSLGRRRKRRKSSYNTDMWSPADLPWFIFPEFAPL